MNIPQLFGEVYNGNTNVMTPYVLEYHASVKYGIEISKGRDIHGQDIYGVTCVDRVKKREVQDKFRLCQSFSNALAYVRELQGE